MSLPANENEEIGYWHAPVYRRANDGTWWGYTSGLVPTQGQGAIDGCEWYFRARDDAWYFVVAVPPLDAVRTHQADPPGAFVREGGGQPYPEQAWSVIEESMKRYREREDRKWSPIAEAQA